MNHQTGDMSYDMGGVKYSGSMNKVESCRWYVLSAMPDSEIMSSYYASVRTILFIFAAGLECV